MLEKNTVQYPWKMAFLLYPSLFAFSSRKINKGSFWECSAKREINSDCTKEKCTCIHIIMFKEGQTVYNKYRVHTLHYCC